jgi:hypothetical protein
MRGLELRPFKKEERPPGAEPKQLAWVLEINHMLHYLTENQAQELREQFVAQVPTPKQPDCI